ncbi:hypothetical protein GJU40_19505 [Bacillus lacus]|uniref:DUF2178 domain-containing protein n=1 Tax=Metabacillus lacus TaxID=1983721 RepID=A0A7X2J2X6_9BACI|nr:hypothetical protein [Metabacillus lacus]MRX74309.1 hypothetical protein [Metabacillus lacus]
MNSSKRTIGFIAFVAFIVVSGFALYKWVRFGTIDGGSIFFSFLLLSYFFNAITWEHPEGEGEKDELDRHIQAQSSRIGYFVLMILSGLILIVSEGVSNLNDINNFPLLIVVGLTFVTLPVTAFIYSKKYK